VPLSVVAGVEPSEHQREEMQELMQGRYIALLDRFVEDLLHCIAAIRRDMGLAPLRDQLSHARADQITLPRASRHVRPQRHAIYRSNSCSPRTPTLESAVVHLRGRVAKVCRERPGVMAQQRLLHSNQADLRQRFYIYVAQENGSEGAEVCCRVVPQVQQAHGGRRAASQYR